MNRTGKVFAAGCLIIAMMAPQAAYGVTQADVQVSAREEIPVVRAPQSSYENVAISRVSNYVNVRTEPNTASTIVGKIYNNCAAVILSSVDGEGGRWYQIQSGNVQGYIKAEYFITGTEAEKIAKQVGTVYVTINTQTLRLREEPNTTSKTLTLLSEDAEYIELKEEGDFVEIQVDSDLSGYVHKDYIEQRVEFKTAVSLEEEQKQIEETERLKKEADEAIARVEELKKAAESAAEGKQQADANAGSALQGNSQTIGSGMDAAGPMESIGLIAANPNETSQNGTGSGSLGGAVQNGMDSENSSKSAQNGMSSENSGTDSGNDNSGAADAGNSQGPGGSGQNAGSGQPALNTAGTGLTSGPQQASGTGGQASGTGQTQSSGTEFGPGAGLGLGESGGPGSSGSSTGKDSGAGLGLGGNVNQSGANAAAPLPSAELTSATRTAIVAYAKQFLGNPYVFGGTSLTEGTDCSGFTMRIFEHFGIETGRSSRDQALKGKEISISEIQPGDLLFYASGDYINHVALYIGGGQVIHASTEKTGIVISTAYYRTPYKAVTFLN